MLHMPRTITTPLSLTVSTGTGEAERGAELRYGPADPFAGSLAIGADCGGPVGRTFARERLGAGVSSPSGEGDIALEPDISEGFRAHGQLRIALATDCMATMLASTDRV